MVLLLLLLKTPHGNYCTSIGFFPRMWAMEHSPYIIEDDAYSRASSFTDLRSAGDQQTFSIRPGNVGTDGFLKDGLLSVSYPRRQQCQGVEFLRCLALAKRRAKAMPLLYDKPTPLSPSPPVLPVPSVVEGPVRTSSLPWKVQRQ